MVSKFNSKKPLVVIGLSGGIDSAVSAYLLLQEGYEVVGVFMQNWDSVANFETNYQTKNDQCDSQIDYEDAKKVANHLGIKLYHKKFIKEYWDNVFSYFINEYKNNRTPNPDILCNKHIKFKSFYNYAFKEFNCDYIAMGHYAKVEQKNSISYLKLCKDQNKDQTYFLCDLTQEQLKKVLFPLSDLTKDEVRQIGNKIGLPNAKKKDSTGICFIGERNFSTFLENYLPNKPGDIIDITNNKIVGKHIGTMYYTIGQRKGLNIGGQKERYFVCKKNLEQKIIYVAPNSEEDKYLLSNYLEINEFNWIIKPTNFNNIKARFRHRQIFQPVNIEEIGSKLIVKYPSQKNIACGQFCVLYQNDICLGGGAIDKTKHEK